MIPTGFSPPSSSPRKFYLVLISAPSYTIIGRTAHRFSSRNPTSFSSFPRFSHRTPHTHNNLIPSFHASSLPFALTSSQAHKYPSQPFSRFPHTHTTLWSLLLTSYPCSHTFHAPSHSHTRVDDCFRLCLYHLYACALLLFFFFLLFTITRRNTKQFSHTSEHGERERAREQRKYL